MTVQRTPADPAMEALLRARAAALAAPVAEHDDGERESLVVFTVGAERYGLPAHTVAEVRPLAELARLPHAPAELLGVARVHSGVVCVLGLPQLLGEADAAATPAAWVVVVDGGDGAPLGLAADAVDGVVPLRRRDVDTGTGRDPKGLSSGVMPDGLRLLDAGALLSLPPPYRPAPGAAGGAGRNDVRPQDRETEIG